MTLFAAVILVVQAGTGATWWALLRRRGFVSLLELLGMGLALGTFASMLTGVLLVTTPLAAIGWLVPTFLVAPVALWVWSRRGFADLRLRTPLPEWIAVAAGLLSGLVLAVVNWSRIPLDAPSSDSFADLFFFEALSRGLAEFGPSQSILMAEGSLRYHWFTYAWAGDLAQNAGTTPFFVITRLLPLVTLVGVIAIAASWSARLSRVRWVPTLAVLLIVVGGYAGALYGSILNFDSPSQAMTTMWLLGFAVAFLSYVTGDQRMPMLIAIAALAAACTGGKISHALVAAGGASLVVLVGLWTRAAWWRRAALATAVAGAAMAVTYVLVLSGVAIDRNLTESAAFKASTWQGLDPVAGRLGVVLGTAALVLAITARFGGLGWLLANRTSRLKPEVLFATGGVLVGLVAMIVLREGVNELWFILAASAPAAVLAADGIGAALRRVRRTSSEVRRPLLWSIVIAMPAAAACLLLSRNWGSHQSVLNWLSPLSVWLLVPVGAIIVILVLDRSPRRVLHVVALSVAGLAITSIATRPAALWTASRPIATVVGTVQPVAGGIFDDSRPTTANGRPPKEVFAEVRDAADWIESNTGTDVILATTDPVSALVPALTGRQMYIAGARYQAGLGRANETGLVAERTAAARAFALAPSAITAGPLCDTGVDFAWFEGQVPDEATQSVVFANDSVAVLSLSSLGCE